MINKNNVYWCDKGKVLYCQHLFEKSTTMDVNKNFDGWYINFIKTIQFIAVKSFYNN